MDCFIETDIEYWNVWDKRSSEGFTVLLLIRAHRDEGRREFSNNGQFPISPLEHWLSHFARTRRKCWVRRPACFHLFLFSLRMINAMRRYFRTHNREFRSVQDKTSRAAGEKRAVNEEIVSAVKAGCGYSVASFKRNSVELVAHRFIHIICRVAQNYRVPREWLQL